ncbi:hypothetical protein LTR36_006022 [Oleoguttula mirabilis]|uniref:SET domain-containing protein n=1 Tax=Oleoguttula mirabilis TaxID=1507867 RepID=A0AAV9JDT6_9PEZI|nr:hypothetical protein LTR36_006022 [Oleoguttula mirabilis]
MAGTSQTEALEHWLSHYGGFLHPSLRLCVNAEAGLHCRATATVDAGTRISTVPHALALSYLNALVDDACPVFKQRRPDFQGVENIGFFYLMVQHHYSTTSFWKPYLETLPKPQDFATPLWFDDPEDLAWLEGTDVLHTMLGRKEVYEQYYYAGVNILAQAGIDTGPFTWDLFRWAVTIFTSRSFSSRAITPQGSKYWTTHKTNSEGRRQTVLLDLSTAPSEDLDFPVLFPVQDAPNHRYDAHVDWFFDPGRFSITVEDSVQAGDEVFNNYGSKGNDELLLGYGFCIPDSPHDSIMLTLKPPPEALQAELMIVQPGLFRHEGGWNSERATFRLKQPMSTPNAKQILMSLPEALLELLLYMLRHERGLPFAFVQRPHEYILEDQDGRRYLPHIARMLVQSLAPKLAKLQSVVLAPQPRNNKQRQASIYRQGQTRILESIIMALRGFTRSLLKAPAASGPRLVTLEGLLELWSAKNSSPIAVPFIAGVVACSGTADVDQLREAGWEEDVLVLLLCYIWLHATKDQQLGTIREFGSVPGTTVKDDWVRQMLPEYVTESVLPGMRVPNEESMGDVEEPAIDTDVETAGSILELVRQAAEAQPDSLWHDSRWSEQLIVRFGKMLQYESMTMMVPKPGSQGEEEARLVVYVHGDAI